MSAPKLYRVDRTVVAYFWSDGADLSGDAERAADEESHNWGGETSTHDIMKISAQHAPDVEYGIPHGEAPPEFRDMELSDVLNRMGEASG